MMRAVPIELPQRYLVAITDLAVRLLDSRKPRTELGALARDLYLGFYDTCTNHGLDRVLVDLERSFPPLDASDRAALADHPPLLAALVAKLEAIDLDGGSPRNAKPRQLADCVVGALDLALVEDAAPLISLGVEVRTHMAAAIGRVISLELGGPKLRDAVIAEARTRCEPQFAGAFDKLTAQLDEHALKLLRLPKVPIDALHATQRVLAEARAAVIDRVGSVAIDRAKDALAQADPESAARIDAPVTLRATPREVALVRAHAGKSPDDIARAMADGVADLLPIAWRAADQVVHPYSTTRTFAVGDLIEHPKFGRGSVVGGIGKNIEVEFPDGKRNLVHVPPRR
jgi:hypothetical protein